MNDYAGLVAALFVVGCSEGGASPRGLSPVPEARELVDDRPVYTEDVALPPVSGGTVLVTRDGSRAIVSSADSGKIYVVDLENAKLLKSVELDPLADPGRAVEDDDGMVHVALRGEGSVVSIEPKRGELARATDACRAPRGIAFDAATREVLVACAEGELVSLPIDGGASERFAIAADLRDVVIANGVVSVTRMRSAEVLELAADRSVATSTQPGKRSLLTESGQVTLKPNTAWRTIATPHGVLMLHQVSSTAMIDLDFTAEEEAPYGGGEDPCDTMIAPALTLVSGNDPPRESGPLSGVVLAVDVAMSPDGGEIAMAVAGQANADAPSEGEGVSVVTIATHDLEDDSVGCGPPRRELPVPGQAVGVAYDTRGWLYVHTRLPSALHIVPADADGLITVALDRAEPRDTGHEIFHLDAGAGIACAQCHPEGGDDGRVWRFSVGGERRTQALNVGLQDTAPFHWEGDLDDVGALLDEVHARRMGGLPQSAERKEAFSRWLFALPHPPAMRDLDDAVARGEKLFANLGCNSCHVGAQLTSNQTVEYAGEPLQVPNLHGVAQRAPYMHDGRAKDLAAAVIDMVEGTAPGRAIAGAELDDVVAYLESL